jgi:SNF2 family DNA or RNA helicase
LLDLFGQAYMMDQGKALGQFITHYKARYFMPADHMGYKWVPQPGSEEKIYAALAPYVLRLDAKDYLELPEMVENDIVVEMPPKAKRFYDSLETEFIAMLDSGQAITAPSSGAALIKLRQCANGAVYNAPVVDDSGIPLNSREWTVLHDEKISALMDLIDELQGSPLLVAYGFKHDLYRLREALGKDVPHIGSGVSGKETNEILKKWNAGELPVLLGHPASMGHGLNMQDAGNHVAWFAPNYDLELYDQFNKRVLRSGNTNSHVYVHRFIAKGTVDELIVAALRRKSKNQGALLDALKEYRQGR